MNKKATFLVLVSAFFGLTQVKAQTYTAKVSKDSIGILDARIEALKASQKIQELKIEEGKEELEVEKLRVKLLTANDAAKESAAKSSKNTERMGSVDVNIKDAEKFAKKAKSDMQDAQKALERYNKQIKSVEKLREKIATEERKLDYKKPAVIFKYN